MTVDIDALIDQVIAEGQLAQGYSLDYVLAQNPQARVGDDLAYIAAGVTKPPRWSETEDALIADQYGRVTDAELAIVLGRSPAGVKIRRQRILRIKGVTANDNFVSANEMSRALGVDGHAGAKLMDRGIVESWPLGERRIRVCRRVTFLRWAVNPLNWCYFYRSVQDTDRLGDSRLKRLIERQKRRWTDEWWTSGQVADYHGVRHTDVNRYLRHGKIAGKRWGNWWVLRSEAMRPGLIIHKAGKGCANGLDWPEAAEAFLLVGLGLGVDQAVLARLAKLPANQVKHRLWTLRCSGGAADVIAKMGLEGVTFDPDKPTLDQVRARWEEWGWMFRRLKRRDIVWYRRAEWEAWQGGE